MRERQDIPARHQHRSPTSGIGVQWINNCRSAGPCNDSDWSVPVVPAVRHSMHCQRQTYVETPRKVVLVEFGADETTRSVSINDCRSAQAVLIAFSVEC
jgi:hypothetical protein